MDQQFAAAPVEVLERDRGDLAGAQPEPRQQQHDRVIAPADQPAPVTTGQQPLHDRRLQPARQRAIPKISDPGHRPLQRQLDQSRDMQISQQRAQPPHQLPRPRHTELRALRREEQAHVRGTQPLKPEPVRPDPPRQEQPRGRLVATEHRVRRQPTLIEQIPAIAHQQPLERIVHNGRHGGRHDPEPPQVPERQRCAPYRGPRRPARSTPRSHEPLHLLHRELIRSQTLALEPPTQQIQLPQPMRHRAARIPPSRQPRRVPRCIRRQRPRRHRNPNPRSHRCLP
jgi:hypothetical protein